MAGPTGAELRRRREALGIDVLSASEAIGLPLGAVEALESDAPHRLTRPPYGERWRQTYGLFLDRVATGDTAVPTSVTLVDGPVDAEREEVAGVSKPPRVPLRWVRVVAALTSAAAIGVVLWGARRDLAGPPPEPDDVVVRVVLQRTARLVVTVDGQLREDREFAGREDVTFRGRTSVDVDVPDVQQVKVWFNDRPIEPRGQLGTRRTLSFRAGAPP